MDFTINFMVVRIQVNAYKLLLFVTIVVSCCLFSRKVVRSKLRLVYVLEVWLTCMGLLLIPGLIAIMYATFQAMASSKPQNRYFLKYYNYENLVYQKG